MNRRDFMKFGALSLSPILVKYLNDWTTETAENNFDIEILSDAGVGHVLWESKDYAWGENLTTQCLIVGGGIAGLSAAYQLRSEDFLLCELSDYLGGSSSANAHKDQYFAQGAHYDLAYPAYYGKEVLKMLYDLNVIDRHPTKEEWVFVDKHYLIASERESITYDKGTFRKDVLPEGKMKQQFEALLRPFVGKMPMPTTLIDPAFHDLNTLTFRAFLEQKLTLDANFIAAIDYGMIDDWGATSSMISALAGIHYYTCRPYFDENPELFSPPQGNAYFAQKIISQLPQERLLANRLVRAIEKNEQGFEVTVIDVKKKQQFKIQTTKIVYAAHKHALKYIYPTGYDLFKNNQYAPWVVINIVLNQNTLEKVYWQNECLSGNPNFMGFVDSAAQFQSLTTRRTLTAYYCLEPKLRNDLLEIDQKAPALVEQTIEAIEEILKQPIRKKIEKVYLKVMGHAMPIPQPNFLLQNPNARTQQTGIAYAGVDSGRLPLFFEAADSGLQAARLLQKLG
ncbi:NAD(P)-binding protein [Aureispira anguillae]|uniref:NAD(P)-binding protein n=1 Tax=Aureispira anguillae TaxID=2864201 RepID=A0A915YHC5_9BACT|nr:NAD(P)-binding protein [Aureispira anguillae]BDS13183.1 NAD(P)-binding protein [Aureispira anguillae]